MTRQYAKLYRYTIADVSLVDIPPPGSVFFHLYPCEIFGELGSQVSLYESTGKVGPYMYLGDLHARTKGKVHDVLHSSVS